MITVGRVIETEGGVVVKTTRPPVENLSDEVTVVWTDKRLRTPEQLRKAWVLMTEIAAGQGESKEAVYAEQKTAFTLKHLEELQGELFGLSTATVTHARDFITMLVDLIVEYGFETKEPLYQLCDDIQRFVYACLMNKKCAVCGRPAVFHHVDTVGMGFNRNKINHIGKAGLPLCMEHHSEAHNIGDIRLMRKYHLEAVEVDERIAKTYKLKVTE